MLALGNQLGDHLFLLLRAEHLHLVLQLLFFVTVAVVVVVGGGGVASV